jgi:hypothetical protein
VVFEGTNFGTFDNIVFRNSDAPQRKYDALLLQSQYRLYDRLQFEGHWTIQLRNEGNFEGEAANQPGISSSVGDYPEILTEARNFPVGRFRETLKLPPGTAVKTEVRARSHAAERLPDLG